MKNALKIEKMWHLPVLSNLEEGSEPVLKSDRKIQSIINDYILEIVWVLLVLLF